MPRRRQRDWWAVVGRGLWVALGHRGETGKARLNVAGDKRTMLE